MIRVTVEVIPFGEEKRKRTIGTMKIVNDGEGNVWVGDYDVHVEDEAREVTGKYKDFKIRSFNRSGGFWRLIGAAIEGMEK